MNNTIKISILSAALMSQLSAQNIQLAPITINSTAIKTDELQSTDAVEVYTQKDIEKAKIQNLYEFLNKYTSVFATSAYGNPFMQKLDMRGFGVGDGYQNIVITIDGRRMNNVDMTAQLLASISPSAIKQIEIIKSSGIVTGGDGANAGSINIITKRTQTKEISFYGGTFGLVDSSFYLGHKLDNITASINGKIQKSDGIRDIDTNGNKDENSLSTVAFNLDYTPSNDLKINLNATSTKTDVTYAGTMTKAEYLSDPRQQGTNGGFSSAYAKQKFDSSVLGTSLSYDLNDEISIKAQISQEIKNSDYELPAWSSTGNSDYKYTSLNTFMDYSTNDISIKVGVDAFLADLDYVNSSNVDLAMKKSNRAIFAVTKYSKKDFTIKGGLRTEKMEFSESGGDKKDENLYGAELGLNYKLDKTHSLFINYAHSFQTTQLDRLFSYTNATAGYMGYVLPSQANSYTLGFNSIQTQNKFKASLFFIDLKNEIYYYSDPAYTNSKNTNIDKSYKYGIDVYNNYVVNDKLNFILNYNYVKAIIKQESENGEDFSNKALPGVSDHNIKAMVNYSPSKNYLLSLTQIYRSEKYAAEDFTNSFSQKQDALNSTDFSATYKKDTWEVFAKINNLFNQKNGLWIGDDKIYPINYTTTGYVGCKFKF